MPVLIKTLTDVGGAWGVALVTCLQLGEASITLIDTHQVDSYVIGNYDIHFACIVVLLVVNPGYDANTS